MAEFSIKQGDKFPKLRMALTDSTGAAIDLTGATVTLRMRLRDGARKIAAGAANIIGATTLGVVEYAWGATDTDTPGVYDAEWVATFSNGTQTVPSSAFVTVVVVPAL